MFGENRHIYIRIYMCKEYLHFVMQSDLQRKVYIPVNSIDNAR